MNKSQKITFIQGKNIFFITILLLFFILFYWNSLNMPWERDEGEYAYNAWLLNNQIAPYEHSFLQKPPMIIYTYWLAQQIAGANIWGPRLLSSLFTLGTILILYLITKIQFNQKTAYFAALIAIPIFSLPHLTALSANTEKFMLLPFIFVIYLFIKYHNQTKTWPMLLAGMAGSLAFLYKPICILPLSFIYLIWLIENWKLHKKIKTTLYQFFYFLFSFIITIFFALTPLLSNKDALTQLWQQVIKFNSQYASGMFQYIWWAPIKYFKIITTTWWFIFIIFLLAWLKPIKLWWFYLILLFLSWLTVFTSPIGHYYLLIMPFLIIVCANGFFNLLNFIETKFKLSDDVINATSLFIGFIIIISLLWPIRAQFTKNSIQMSIWIYGYGNPFIESQLTAERIKQISTPQDKIFVAGSESQIYYFSQRQSVSRFNITYPLITKSDWQNKFQQQALSDITQNNPKVIVYSPLPDSGLWSEDSPRLFIDGLNALIKEKYQLVGGFVRDQNYGYWQEPMTTQEQMNNSSLLLFQKK